MLFYVPENTERKGKKIESANNNQKKLHGYIIKLLLI